MWSEELAKAPMEMQSFDVAGRAPPVDAPDHIDADRTDLITF